MFNHKVKIEGSMQGVSGFCMILEQRFLVPIISVVGSCTSVRFIEPSTDIAPFELSSCLMKTPEQ